MKTLLLTLGLMAACVRAGYAVEYTYIDDNKRSVSVSDCDVIELQGYAGPDRVSSNFPILFVTQANGRRLQIATSSGQPLFGGKFTGVTLLEADGGLEFLVTLKITRAAEIGGAGPTSMLIMPENAAGNYNLVVESSGDLECWIPFHSQTVSSLNATRFFRTRIVKAE